MKNTKGMPEKSLQVISCAMAVVVMILLMSGDMIMSKILRVNPNQNYPYEEQDESSKEEKKEEDSSTIQNVDLEYDVSFMKPTNLIELQEYIQKGELIYVFSGRRTCAPCRRFVPILKKVVEDLGITNIYYLNQSEINNMTDGYQNFQAYSNELQEKFGTTPYFMIFKDQKYLEGQIGMMKTDELLEDYLKELFQKY